MEAATLKGAELTTINGRGQQFVRLKETIFNKGLSTSSKTGFIEVEPKHAKAVLKSIQSGETQVEWGRFNRNQGLYDIIVVQAEEEPAAENAAATANAGEIKQEA